MDECYRRRLSPGQGATWEWVSEEKLPRGMFLASERRATVRGDAYQGDLIAQFAREIWRGEVRPAKLTSVWIVEGGDEPLTKCEHTKRRDGKIAVRLPNGSEIIVPSADWR